MPIPNSHTFEAAFELTAVNDLFDTPDVSPLDERYREHSTMRALEFIADQIYANASYKSARATFTSSCPVP